jgi:dipeptidase
MAAFALGSLLWAAQLGCTTLIAGRGATVDGSTLATHSNDGEGNVDPRLVHIPARDHAPGSKRPIYWSPETFPRYVGFDRGADAYYPVGKQRAWEPIGYIDEVAHTYGYHEQTYGALNEHGVGIGESTCAGVFAAAPLGRGGRALFSVDQLTQLAMERATTSREAVQLMGSLAVAHGWRAERLVRVALARAGFPLWAHSGALRRRPLASDCEQRAVLAHKRRGDNPRRHRGIL